MSQEFWDEVFKLVDEYDQQRPKVIKEFRLYYNDDGSIIGLWETGHPESGNYIVLDDPGIFFRTNTHSLKVIDKKLQVIDLKKESKVRLHNGNKDFCVVEGHASLILTKNETYQNTEYYDSTNN